MWHKYQCLQVYNAVAMNWVKLMIVPSIFNVSSAIIFCLYISIRHTDLPILTYLLFPYLATIILILMFWLGLELVRIIRASETIVETLGALGTRNGNGLTMQQRLYIRKKAKATRPLGYRVGEFVDVSLDLPVGVWEEIINQLAFLLTY